MLLHTRFKTKHRLGQPTLETSCSNGKVLPKCCRMLNHNMEACNMVWWSVRRAWPSHANAMQVYNMTKHALQTCTPHANTTGLNMLGPYYQAARWGVYSWRVCSASNPLRIQRLPTYGRTQIKKRLFEIPTRHLGTVLESKQGVLESNQGFLDSKRCAFDWKEKLLESRTEILIYTRPTTHPYFSRSVGGR